MGKFWFHRIFLQDPHIQPYLPDTAICTPASLKEFLEKYQAVYIKPAGGGRGIGIIKAWREKNRLYYVLEKGNKVACRSEQDMYQKLKLAQKKRHIVQRAIPLAKVQGRPFDIRLMMMRDEQEKWIHVGMVAKVAGEQSIITNVARGKGHVISVDQALQKSLGAGSEKIKQWKQEMIRLAHHCSRVYSMYRYEWQIGYDIGVDRQGKVWYIEANPRVPAHGLFRKFEGEYDRIRKLALFHKRKQHET